MTCHQEFSILVLRFDHKYSFAVAEILRIKWSHRDWKCFNIIHESGRQHTKTCQLLRVILPMRRVDQYAPHWRDRTPDDLQIHVLQNSAKCTGATKLSRDCDNGTADAAKHAAGTSRSFARPGQMRLMFSAAISTIWLSSPPLIPVAVQGSSLHSAVARAVLSSKVLTGLSTRIIHGANHRCRNLTLRSGCVIVLNDELRAMQYLKSLDSKNFALMDGFLASLSLQDCDMKWIPVK
jgi:hypothetical protein